MHSLKDMKWQSLMTAALYIIMGIVLLIFPETTAKTLCYVVGISGIVIGAFTVLSYLFREVTQNYYRNDFVIGMVAILLGAAVLYKAELVIALIPLILGILVVFSGITKLQNSIDIRRMGYGNGLVFLVLAILNILLGAILIIDPFNAVKVLFMVIGVGLLFSGISDTIATLYMASKVKLYISKTEVTAVSVTEIKEEEE